MDDDAFAVADASEPKKNENIEIQIYKQGIKDSHVEA